jgi:hypothetical protein
MHRFDETHCISEFPRELFPRFSTGCWIIDQVRSIFYRALHKADYYVVGPALPWSRSHIARASNNAHIDSQSFSFLSDETLEMTEHFWSGPSQYQHFWKLPAGSYGSADDMLFRLSKGSAFQQVSFLHIPLAGSSRIMAGKVRDRLHREWWHYN